MTRRVVFLHTVPSLAALFTDLSKELLPSGYEIVHIADELLLKVVLEQGGLSPFIHQRVAAHAAAAEQSGAVVMQCTCSSISPCVETARPLVSIPVLKIDQPMISCALASAPDFASPQAPLRIGVMATAPTTLKPTTEQVQAAAAEQGKKVTVSSVLRADAYAALMSGDIQTHDAILRDTILAEMKKNDILLLAQASMARVLAAIPPADLAVPVFTSPRLAVQRLAEVISALS
jgi:hypothetical protein